MTTPHLKLISHKLCPYVQRARIVLDEKSIPHEIEFIDLKNKPAWFLRISPLGKVPVLVADNQAIFESAVIAEYLDEITPGTLHPENPVARARARSWIEFASNTLATIGAFYSAPDEATFQLRLDSLRSQMRRLDTELGDGPYFNGTRFSLVDAAFGPVFRYFDVIEQHADFRIFDEAPKVQNYRKNLSERPSVQRAVVSDYPQRLLQFLLERQSHLSSIIAARQVA